MYLISFSKRIFGLPFTITSVIVQSARNPERACRAAQLKFMRWSRIPHWRAREPMRQRSSRFAQCPAERSLTGNHKLWSRCHLLAS